MKVTSADLPSLGFQSHYVFYTEERDHVLIRAPIHVGQQLRPTLFE
jgi:hypothetical protein